MVSSAALNMSTSLQLGFIVNGDANLCKLDACNSVVVLPYFGDSYLAVAASLNGGNVIHSFVLMLKSWMSSLGMAFIYTSLVECICMD